MKTRRVFFLLLFDIVALNVVYLLSLYYRFEGLIPYELIQALFSQMTYIVIIKLIVFYICKLYKSIWEYASIDELLEIALAVVIGNAFSVLFLFVRGVILPRSVLLMVPIIDMLFIGGIRFSYRILRRLKRRFQREKDYKRVLIVGAGAAGSMVLKELRNHENLHSKAIGFIDDDLSKKGTTINRVPVLGTMEDINKICERFKVDEIIIAMPSTKAEDRKRILNQCKETKCKTKILPGMYELIGEEINFSKIRDVQIEDLLGRDEVNLELDKLSQLISGKKVLVTGGGGSIGSELCRQISGLKPKKLIILDIYENNAYDIQNELLKKYKDLDLKIIIASVRDKERIEEIMEDERPNIIFHAAAHKHVPMMEDNPKAAVKNNIFGTLNVVKFADKYNVEKFVLISTDKAVNPTNVMGATKRVCEMIMQTYNRISKTDYVAVRFGNVLGSNGSVIPVFKRQIASGGPVTVTDERVIRYFMTIPEACQLVLQTGAIAHGGEIFVLDMGEQVKIIDLARDLIKLSGFEPETEIPIVITGLRPGEKLYEEMLIDKEKMLKTDHNKIYIEEPMEFEYDELMSYMVLLKESIKNKDTNKIKDTLAYIVPGYIPWRDNCFDEDLILNDEVAVTVD